MKRITYLFLLTALSLMGGCSDKVAVEETQEPVPLQTRSGLESYVNYFYSNGNLTLEWCMGGEIREMLNLWVIKDHWGHAIAIIPNYSHNRCGNYTIPNVSDTGMSYTYTVYIGGDHPTAIDGYYTDGIVGSIKFPVDSNNGGGNGDGGPLPWVDDPDPKPVD